MFILQLIRVFSPEFPVGKVLGLWLLFCLMVMPKRPLLYNNIYHLYIISSIIILFYVGIVGAYNAGIIVVLTEFFQAIMPIFYFGIIQSEESNSKLMDLFVSWLVVVLTFSLVLFFIQPMFYREFLHSIENTGTDIPLTSNFFRSIFGLTLTGLMSLIGLIWSLNKKNNNLYKFISLLILFSSLILAARKSAVILFLLYFLMFISRRPLVLLLLVGIVLIKGDFILSLISVDILERIALVVEGLEGRSNSWNNAVKNFSWFGFGLGYAGHNNPIGSVFVPDNWYLKTIVENGVFAFISIPLIFLSVYGGRRPVFRLERVLLFFILAHSFTSNTLSFMFVLFITGILFNSLYNDRALN